MVLFYSYNLALYNEKIQRDQSRKEDQVEYILKYKYSEDGFAGGDEGIQMFTLQEKEIKIHTLVRIRILKLYKLVILMRTYELHRGQLAMIMKPNFGS